MKCLVCGNPVPRDAVVCPYCESPLSREARPKAPAVQTINLKRDDLPADSIADRMETMIANARAAGSRVVILIHGYGSGGEGGVIRQAVRRRLIGMQNRRGVRLVIFGENFGPGSDPAIRLAAEHQTLLAPHVFGAGNEGITIVAL